jgi:long-chain acyl-CoA synthetase
MSVGLVQRWRQQVEAAPASPAVIEAAAGATVSRKELLTRAESLSGRWQQEYDDLAGRWIAFSLPNGAAWLETFLAALICRAVPVPLDPSEPIATQEALARGVGAHFILRTGGVLTSLQSRRRRSADEACLVKLTSGSTGTPRPLLFTHAQMLADGAQVCATMDIRPEDLNLAAIPFGHSYGLGNLVVPLLAQGTAALCTSTPLPHVLAAETARWRPTVFPTVPALLRVLAASDVAAEALRSLRVVISAGSTLPAEIAQNFLQKFGLRVHSFYGSSETGGIAYDRSGEATLSGRSVGAPLEGVRLVVGRGQRFFVESAAVFTHGNPLVRKRAADAPGIHRPADRAELNELGELVLLGRAGRMAKVSGRRLDLAGLERELSRLPGLKDAFVITHPSEPDQLAAVIASDLPTTEIRTVLARELAAWKIPRRLIVVKEFPLTARGKTDTAQLRAVLGRRPS